jgi:hypothetical protein
VGLAAVPPLVLVAAIARYFVNVPFYEQWWLLRLFAADREGRLDWTVFWDPFGDHRVVWPRVVMVLLARVFHYNLWPEAWFSVGLACGILAVLVWLAWPAMRGPGVVILPVLSLVVFSLSQWENWVWTLQLMFFMTMLFAVAALAVLARGGRGTPTQDWRRLGLAVLLAAGASTSFSTGLATWPAGLVVILGLGLGRRDLARAAVWVVAGILMAAAYKHGLRYSPTRPVTETLVAAPHRVLQYALAYLGAPMVPSAWPRAGMVAGVVAVGAVAGWVTYLWRREMRVCGAVPCAILAAGALVVFALTAAAMTALGRVEHGLGQAMSPRYVTFSHALYLAALLALAWCLSGGARSRRGRQVAGIALAVLAVGLVAASVRSVEGLRWRRNYIAEARDELFRLQDDKLLRRLYVDTRQLREEFIPLARRHGLSLFRGERPALDANP